MITNAETCPVCKGELFLHDTVKIWPYEIWQCISADCNKSYEVELIRDWSNIVEVTR